jgi:uncharacterized protein YndB with AHSA1/START domain
LNKFEISRTFQASKEQVFAAWTEAGQLAQWWGPKGFLIKVVKLDLRPGGIFHYHLQTADGYEMWGRFVYSEIEPSEKLVFVNSFSDAEGNITRAPFSEDWPLEIRNCLLFSEAGGKTTITFSGKPLNATEEEKQMFQDNFDSMTNGFTGTFDQLEKYLAKQSI